MKHLRAPRRTLLAIGGALLVGALFVPASAALAATSVSYTFDTAGDLAAGFDGYVASGAVAQTLTGGLSNSGAINAPASANAVFTSRAGYSVGPVGSSYTFSSFVQSVGNSGYSGMGFTSLTASAANASGSPYRPIDALGISVHGGGFVFHNGATDLFGLWASSSNAGITTVTPATIPDLLNNGSPDRWYKVVLVITRDSATTFDMRVEIWPSTSTGTLLYSSASAIFELQNATNSTITTAPVIHSYINFSGDRVRYFDGYNVGVAGGASVIEEGAPVVLTSGGSAAGAVVTLAGEITDAGTAPVTARGFVYSTSPSPTVANSLVGAGSGTGTFTGSTPALAAGTYYFRAFATSTVDTSYGSEVQVVVAAAQTITFAQPSDQVVNGGPLVVVPTASSGLTPVLSSSTTAVCTVSGMSIAFVSAGTCTITATQAGNATYSAAAPVTRSFEITELTQTITFAQPADQDIDDGPLVVAPTASSGLTPVLSSSTPATCSVSGMSISFVSAGVCTITATQAGNGTYAAAAEVIRFFDIALVAQAITFTAPVDQPISTGSIVVAPTASSGLAPLLTSGTTAVCTVAGFTITLVATGECTVTASQPGDGTYAAATPVAHSFDITHLGQTITFAQPSDVSLDDPALALTASSDAVGLTPTLTSATPAVCTVSGASVSFVATGVCTITASQAGNGTYAAAASVDRSFRVIAITTRSLTSMTTGAAANQQLAVAGAAGGGVWSTSTPLPAGLSISATTGLLSGTPTVAFSGFVTFVYTENGVAHDVSLLLDIRSGAGLARTGTDVVAPVAASIVLLLLGGLAVASAVRKRERLA